MCIRDSLLPEYVTTAQLYQIVSMTSTQLTDMKDSITNHVQDVLYTGVRADDIDSAKTDVISAVTEQGDMTDEEKELVSAVVTNDLDVYKRQG